MQENKMSEQKTFTPFGVYSHSILTKKIVLYIDELGNNIKSILEQKLNQTNEGKCIKEGFIKPSSIKVITYSAGTVYCEKIQFQVVFECMLCHPVEGMIIDNCVVKTITKAGIHAEVITDRDIIPINVFVARDHHNLNEYFNEIKEKNTIKIKVIGVRYEINDNYICVIGELVNLENHRTFSER
jgi:DNA-directed RNA polymerase subunit E'/Rpb7